MRRARCTHYLQVRPTNQNYYPDWHLRSLTGGVFFKGFSRLYFLAKRRSVEPRIWTAHRPRHTSLRFRRSAIVAAGGGVNYVVYAMTHTDCGFCSSRSTSESSCKRIRHVGKSNASFSRKVVNGVGTTVSYRTLRSAYCFGLLIGLLMLGGRLTGCVRTRDTGGEAPESAHSVGNPDASTKGTPPNNTPTPTHYAMPYPLDTLREDFDARVRFNETVSGAEKTKANK